MGKPIKLILVDDNPTFLEGLSSLIESDGRYSILAKFSSGDQLLKSDLLGYVDIALLDIEMPGLNGLETAKRINFLFPQIKLIAITMYQDSVYLQQLIGAGFKGFVNKTQVGENLHSAIYSVMNNAFHFPDNIELDSE